MREFSRQDRLADQIKKEVAEILQFVIKDPRLGFVTVTDVELSKDLKYARVFFSSMGSQEERAKSAKVLERTKGVVQAELGKRIHARKTPIITYKIDKSLERGQRINELLEQIKNEKAADEGQDDDSDS